MERKLKHITVPSSEITPHSVYLSRRDFLNAAGIVSAAAFLAACGLKLPSTTGTGSGSATPTQSPPVPDNTQGQTTDELGNPLNTFDEITNYNNYYEFSTNKQAVAQLSANFKTTPWAVEVGGLVQNPKTYALEDLLRFEQKERVYRLRCVEAWSMVIPWTGFELGDLLNEVQPMTSAKYVRFVTLMDKTRMPGEGDPLYPWPYNEGLRLDEAMQRLTIIATGLYGQSLPNPDGAPLRLVVPWKYGFKSIKAIVKIELTEQRPQTLWNTIAPNEYGFYSNVNPEVDHPRWSQASERRIGELSRRPTLMFNGYADEVASLYTGMDLRANY
ncbi:MAG: protein-methionine-sulfoxide reductase catalytic subunit MsrP [Chloroflexi bacterium]|nr:protein-methionine-sulfoxide reductase catalytic subunit MsrP [Chloroflexota bacterium]